MQVIHRIAQTHTGSWWGFESQRRESRGRRAAETRMLENAKIYGLLLWLDIEENGVFIFNVYPTDKIGPPVTKVSF